MHDQVVSIIKKYIEAGYGFDEIKNIILEILREIKMESDKKKLDNLEEGIIIIDVLGNIVYANKKAQIISGYDFDYYVGKNIEEFLEKEEIEKLYQRLIIRKLGNKGIFFYKTRFKHKNGNIISIKVGSTIIEEKNEKFIMLTIFPQE